MEQPQWQFFKLNIHTENKEPWGRSRCNLTNCDAVNLHSSRQQTDVLLGTSDD